jgi:hypothetical protein
LVCDAPPLQCLEWHIKPKLRKARDSDNGRGYRALCPAHDDRNHSFSIGVSDDGKRILYRCFACENRRRERLALIRECGISPSCLPTPAREKEDLLDYIERLASADTADHAEVRLRIMAALEGYYPGLPRGGELERMATQSHTARAGAFAARKRGSPVQTDKTSSYSPDVKPVKPRRSE